MASYATTHSLTETREAGIAVAALFLRLNGYQLTATNEELESFTLNVTTQKPDLAEITEWFSRHSSRMASHND
jgi:prophage maintenance system killer protein